MTQTQEKPNFNWISTFAFDWFLECWAKASEIFHVIHAGNKQSPTLGQHFCNHYGITDKELAEEKDLDKQIAIIKSKYVSNKTK